MTLIIFVTAGCEWTTGARFRSPGGAAPFSRCRLIIKLASFGKSFLGMQILDPVLLLWTVQNGSGGPPWCWRAGPGRGSARTSVARVTSLGPCQARQRVGSASARATRSQTRNLSTRRNLEERHGASAGAGAGSLAVTLSPGKEGRKAGEGLSGLCFKVHASGSGGVSAAGEWWQPRCKCGRCAASGGGGGGGGVPAA